MREHQAEQECERADVRQLWQNGGWLFTDPTGTVLTPRTETKHWKELLTAAGVRDARFHDARHTAATGASTKELMARMGQDSPRAALIYQHASRHVDQTIADKLSALIEGIVSTAHDRDDEDGPPGALRLVSE